MAEVENLNEMLVFVNSVINTHGRMKGFANAGTLRNYCTNVRKVLKKFGVVKECCSEPFGCCLVISANVV